MTELEQLVASIEAFKKTVQEQVDEQHHHQELQADMIMKINGRLDALEKKPKSLWQKLMGK